MLHMIAIIMLPFAVGVAGRLGIDAGWLLWLVALPAMIVYTLRTGIGVGLLLGAAGAAPLLLFHPEDGLRYVAQIVLPAVIAGWVGQRSRLRIRDGWWLATLAAGASAAVGVAFGREAALREVVLPAGIPTGWVQVVVDRWSGFIGWLSIDPYVFERFERFADVVEPTLWFGALVPLMGAAVALAYRGGEAPDPDPRRTFEADLALGTLVAGMAVGVAADGVLQSIGANVAVIASVFFVLEGVGVVATLFRRWNPGRLAQVLGWSLLATQPLSLMLLPAVGIGTLWLDWPHRTDDSDVQKGT